MSVCMFTRVGSDEVKVGSCHPGQARILVKKELAAWEGNKLFLRLSPAWLDVDTVDTAWALPYEPYVSKDLIEKRRTWFCHIMGKMAMGMAEVGTSRLEHISACGREAEVGLLKWVEVNLKPEGWRRADEPFEPDPDTMAILGEFWESKPDVSGAFRHPPRTYNGPGCVDVIHQDQEPDSVSLVKFHNNFCDSVLTLIDPTESKPAR